MLPPPSSWSTAVGIRSCIASRDKHRSLPRWRTPSVSIRLQADRQRPDEVVAVNSSNYIAVAPASVAIAARDVASDASPRHSACSLSAAQPLLAVMEVRYGRLLCPSRSAHLIRRKDPTCPLERLCCGARVVWRRPRRARHTRGECRPNAASAHACSGHDTATPSTRATGRWHGAVATQSVRAQAPMAARRCSGGSRPRAAPTASRRCCSHSPTRPVNDRTTCFSAQRRDRTSALAAGAARLVIGQLQANAALRMLCASWKRCAIG